MLYVVMCFSYIKLTKVSNEVLFHPQFVLLCSYLLNDFSLNVLINISLRAISIHNSIKCVVYKLMS